MTSGAGAQEAYDFSSGVVAVTGGAGALGAELARAFAASGARVAVLDLEGSRARETAAGIAGARREAVRGYAVDVTDEGSVDAALGAVRAELGLVSILVVNAGICSRGSLEELTASEWRRTLEVNLTGAFLCMRAASRQMIERGGGRIVTVGSVAARVGGMAVSAAYTSSKAGLAGLTRAAARQLARHHILVNCVAPSTLDTGMTSGWEPETLEGIRATVPLGRLGSARDVVGAVLFLCSPRASYITGVTLDVTGGLYFPP